MVPNVGNTDAIATYNFAASQCPVDQSTSMTSWAGLASTAFRAAADTISSIPPPDPDLPLLRRLFVLGQLSTLIYDVRATDVGQTKVYTLPLAHKGPSNQDGDHYAMVTATLMHVRDVDIGQGESAQARMETPQKFGVWLVSGLGVVVAFRGTANEHDMMVNLELTPVPVQVGGNPDGTTRGVPVGNVCHHHSWWSTSHGMCMNSDDDDDDYQSPLASCNTSLCSARVQLHRGFYHGCLDHIEDILTVVAEARNAAGGPSTPLWLTGHSLGGAYAAALTLHLLVNHAQHAPLFAGGTQAHSPACSHAHVDHTTNDTSHVPCMSTGTLVLPHVFLTTMAIHPLRSVCPRWRVDLLWLPHGCVFQAAGRAVGGHAGVDQRAPAPCLVAV